MYKRQVQKSDGLADVAAEASVVFVALQGLEKLNNLSHLLRIELRAAEGDLPQLRQIGLGCGQPVSYTHLDIKTTADTQGIWRVVEGTINS